METHSDRSESRRETIERQNLNDMLLTLEHLFEREEATARIVLECLYNMGAENLLAHKVRLPVLRVALRPFANLSKPLFLFFALRWFKAKCPWLISDWLRSLVVFDDSQSESEPPSTSAEVLELPSTEPTPPETLTRDREIQRLNTQVRLLASTLAVTVAVLGSLVAWLGYERHITRSIEAEPAITTQDERQEISF